MNNRKILAASLLTAALVGLTACGSPAATAAKTTASAPAPTSAPTGGCAVTKTDELYVTEMYTCTNRATKVYAFNTSSARDSYRKVAEEFGSVVVGQGDTWLEVKAE